MMRSVLLAFLCLGASIARAEGTLPGGATITFNKLLLHENNSPELQEPETPESQLQYFNLAHCVCSLFNYNGEIPGFFEGTFAYELIVENATMPVDQTIEIWTGTECDTDDPTIRDAQCFKTAVSAGTVNAIQQAGSKIIEVPIYDVMTPTMRMGCIERELDGNVWALADGEPEDDATLDYGNSATVKTDSKPPPLPINFRAVGAENAIELSWDHSAEGVADVAYYQALCASTVSGAPAKPNPPAARYQTPRQLCGASQDATLMPTEIESNTGTDPDAGDSLQLPQELAQLSPTYICGETSSSTAQSMRIEGLENGVPYTVVFLAIDRSGNANGTYFTSSLVPQPATDFWEDLHDQGSQVEGGLCLLAQAYGDGNPLTDGLRAFRDRTLADTAFGRWLIDVYYATIGTLDLHGILALRILVGVLLLPLVAVALLWHALTLPGLLALIALGVLARRRRLVLARLAAASTVALVALVPARASAQVPYWEESDFTDPAAELPPGDPERVTWHAGIRLGPYVPGIDAQLDMPVGGYDGPYEQMFGGYSVLPMLDIDRILWKGFGQLGVGVSIGYMGKKARAWVANSDPMDPDRPRAEGDENKFRMIPMSLNAVYRFSYLDDAYGIPVIPYARGGLAYHLWWITAPNGDIATSCIGPNTDGCARTSALGGSLGLVGSIGVAIRAERIDADAARSMRESGIEHAGFYAEWSVGKVDGFGSEKKLSVGDSTWFAGVDFEF